MAYKIIRKLLDLRDVNADSIADGETLVWDDGASEFVPGTSGGGAPSGPAGGVLGGSYPDPSFAVDMATQAELDAHLNDTSSAHAASAISIADVANDFTATDVEGALAELQSDAEADATGLSDHLADTAGAHDASAISVVDTGGYYTGTDVEAALQEVGADVGSQASDLAAHEADTTSVHGIADTSSLALTSDLLLPDGVTLEQNVSEVRVKDGGITIAKLSFDPATQTELDAHLNDSSDAHDASAISVVDAGGYFAGTDLEAVTQELGAGSGGGGGIASGTSFPGSPSSGDLFFRTDQGHIFYYDGTRWLTVATFRQVLALSNTALTSSFTAAYCPLSAGLNMWALSLDIVSYVGSPTDATNYWTIDFQKVTAGNTWSSVASRDTKADTATQWTATLLSAGALIQSSAHKGLRILATKTASPGGIFLGVALNYKLVGA